MRLPECLIDVLAPDMTSCDSYNERSAEKNLFRLIGRNIVLHDQLFDKALFPYYVCQTHKINPH